MTIDINQKKISVGDKYQIFVDGQQTHKAAAKLFRLLTEIGLFEFPADQQILTIKKRLSFFTAKYDIINNNQEVFEFRTKSFWKGHFRCQCGFDQYDVYKHTGRKCSIYKNEEQIGWWDKKAVTWFNGDNYTITADVDCDKKLVIAFCLIIDNYSSNDSDKGTLNVDVGRIGPQAKKFHPYWTPKI